MTKEEEILATAEEEFFRNGYDASSTAIIARRAGKDSGQIDAFLRERKEEMIRILSSRYSGKTIQ